MNFKQKIVVAALAVAITGSGIFGANVAQAQTDASQINPVIAQMQQMIESLKQQIQQIVALITQLKPLEICGNGICRFGETETSCAADCGRQTAVVGYQVNPASNVCAKSGESCAISKCPASSSGIESKCVEGGSNCCAGLICQLAVGGRGVCVPPEDRGDKLKCLADADCVETCGFGDCVAAKWHMQLNCASGSGLTCRCNNGICVKKAVCGNGKCENGETTTLCPADCAIETCVKEGGIIDWRLPKTPECCAGLTKILDCSEFNCSKSSNSICTFCGNGICGLGENSFNCKNDCG